MHDDGFPFAIWVGMQTVLLDVAGVTIKEGTTDAITYTVYTRDTINPIQNQALKLKQDRLPPMGFITMPVMSSTWSPGDFMSITWYVQDVTSGLTNTLVRFRLDKRAQNQPEPGAYAFCLGLSDRSAGVNPPHPMDAATSTIVFLSQSTR